MAAYFALLGFIAFMVGTPGPANLLAMLAGVRQGLRGCIGFISGLVFGTSTTRETTESFKPPGNT